MTSRWDHMGNSDVGHGGGGGPVGFFAESPPSGTFWLALSVKDDWWPPLGGDSENWLAP